MADFGTFDLSNVLANVDQIRSAQLQRQLYGNQLAEVERKRQEEQEIRAARSAAWGGDKAGIAQLAGLDPQAAVSLQQYYDGLSKEKRAQELDAAQKATERLAKSAAWVKSARTPEEAAGRWAIIRKSDPKMGKQMPEQYDPAMVDLAIQQAQSLGDVLAGLDKERSSQAFSGAMGALQGSYFDQMAQKESGGDYGAQNPNSSASGKYQFTAGTWKSVMGDAPMTPENQEVAMRKLTDQNAQALSRAGFNPSPEVLALAHQQGVGGAIQLLSNPQAPAASIVGRDAVVLNGGNEAMTAGEFAQHVMGYYAGGGGQAQQPQPQGPEMDPRYLALMQAAGMMPKDDPRGDVLMKVAESFKPQQAPGVGDRYRNVGDQLVDLSAQGGPQAVPLPAPQAKPADVAKSEASLRQEFSALPPVKNFTVQANAMSQLAASAKDPSAAGDLSLIYSYMKMLDPNSVVRETEFATAQNAAGVPDQIRNIWNRALSGERLNPDQRNDFVSRAQSIYDGAKQQYDALAQQYQGLASGQGVNPQNVIPQFGYQGQMPGQQPQGQPPQGQQQGPVQIQTVDQYNQLPSGTQYVDPNGQVRTKRWDNDPIVGQQSAPWEADPVVQQPQQESPGFFARLGNAAEGVLNDLGSAFQGVNPVAMNEAVGQAVGVLKPISPGSDKMVVDVDGVLEPVEKYPPDRFATVQRDGMTLVIPRSAKDSAGESVEEGRLASAGRLAGWGLPTGVPMAAKGASEAQQAAQAAEDVGVTPSFAMRGTVQGKLAAAGEQFAPTAGAFRRDAQRVTGEIADAAGKLADRAGPGITPVDAGEALQRGGETYVRGVRDFQGNLYRAVDQAIAPETPVQATETLKALAAEGDKLRKLPNTITPERLQALQDGSMTWEQARALRTDIGTALRSFDGAETNVAKGQLDQIYKALSTDLDTTVQAAGPEAVQAWNRANTYKRVSEERITTAFAKLLGDKVTPEQAYARLTAMTAEGGGRANIEAVRRVFQSLPKDDKAVVAGTIIRRLGRAAPGAQDAAGETFSASTFLTNWNKMSPAARSTIASSGMDEGVRQGLDQLAKVVERAKEAGTFRNTSNTGNVATAAALGGGVVAAPISTIATAIGSWTAAQLVTMPKLLHAVNRLAATGKSDSLELLAKAGGPEAIEAINLLRLQAQSGTSSPRSQPTAGG